MGSLAEACTIIRRLWTEDEPFDFDGAYHHLTAAWCNPKPLQRPHPQILIGGRSLGTFAWSPSTPRCGTCRAATSTTQSAAARCSTASALRSAATPLRSALDHPAGLLRAARRHRGTIRQAIDAGFAHIVLSLFPPYPVDAAHWVADEFISPAGQCG